MKTINECTTNTTYGSGAPTSTPELGAIYIDTANNRCYVGIGNSNSNDWKKVVSQ